MKRIHKNIHNQATELEWVWTLGDLIKLVHLVVIPKLFIASYLVSIFVYSYIIVDCIHVGISPAGLG